MVFLGWGFYLGFFRNPKPKPQTQNLRSPNQVQLRQHGRQLRNLGLEAPFGEPRVAESRLKKISFFWPELRNIFPYFFVKKLKTFRKKISYV